MKALIFFPAAYRLAETPRTLKIAKACTDSLDILCLSFGERMKP
ncbi:MAG: hypothetical protein SWH78_12870 [Thermodesulfobacteriota bacterium]|nr:hypothetical protein [Thermodesulfobacteriota bacterium]